ncbi:MaoC/PaaZ C-terminal domain-containing protein [Nakamurella sp.]|uniref:MaoC/PaaZ C-terminal domain-containing protein n=1 Tax=Nakamurella sp. TaxID=1869182 RepID=UPI003B3BBCA7
MSAIPQFESVSVGDELAPLTMTVERARLVRYAGASGDFNRIHWSESTAAAVGLPGILAHGMLTMALAGRVVTDWVGDPGAVIEFGTRFTRPVFVPDDGEGATVEFTGAVRSLDADTRTAQVDITAKYNGQAVLGRARATVALS